MSAAQFSVLGLSLICIGLQLWKGRSAERIAAVAFLAALLITPLVDGFQIGGLRWGVGLLAVGLFATLVWLSLVADRWWLVAAAGVQLLSIATYLIVLLNPDIQVWASVSFRIVVWTELMMIGLFGVWECRAAPYAQPTPVAL
ncbi:hypothetical protein [uncultured Brevundimonas sp.]|uniref:hypothetical protein n=1 Tax=uncultured Brevundimonas sp. TaxID=213418 RepID=UPI0030EB3212|tara:strand:- start:3483 stop:3911 length:429 start_codon:yes stop_codon:yes gene_type:complete